MNEGSRPSCDHPAWIGYQPCCVGAWAGLPGNCHSDLTASVSAVHRIASHRPSAGGTASLGVLDDPRHPTLSLSEQIRSMSGIQAAWNPPVWKALCLSLLEKILEFSSSGRFPSKPTRENNKHIHFSKWKAQYSPKRYLGNFLYDLRLASNTVARPIREPSPGGCSSVKEHNQYIPSIIYSS